MRRLPPLNALQIFETVARYGSFTRAAEHLCLTQGAVSRQILALEQYYGLPLFRRSSKGLTLTAEGEQLLPAVRDGFGRIEEASQRLTRQRTELALKVPTCVMRWMLPRIMRFQNEHPDLQIQITTTWGHEVDFQAEPFDAAIIYGSSPGADVHAVPLFDEYLTPVCTPEVLSRRALVTPDDLAHQTLLHPTRDHADWRLWLARAGAKQVDADLGPTFESLDLAATAAMQGFGIAITDRTLVREDVETRRLVMPFDLAVPTGSRYYFVYPECVAQQQKVQLFSDWIGQDRSTP